MISSAPKFEIRSAQRYELQAIIGFDAPTPSCFEVLYRPDNTDDAGLFFEQLSKQEKISFDINMVSQLPALLDEYENINLSVNLSPYSFGNTSFLNLFNNLISSGQIDCHRLCLEIVETDPLSPLSAKAMEVLDKYKDLGGQLALDDFGTGHTHWELIHKNYIDVIKVASQNMPNKSSNQIFPATVAFAKQFGLKSVIEGIETKEEYDFAKSSGFNFCQGWLFNKWKLSL